MKAAGIEKGSGTPNKEKNGKVTEKQILEIATQKMPDLNAASVEAAVKTIAAPPAPWASKSSPRIAGRRSYVRCADRLGG